MRYSADEALDAVMEDDFDKLDDLNGPVTGDSDDEIGFEDWDDNDIDRESEKEDNNENDGVNDEDENNERIDTENILLYQQSFCHIYIGYYTKLPSRNFPTFLHK